MYICADFDIGYFIGIVFYCSLLFLYIFNYPTVFAAECRASWTSRARGQWARNERMKAVFAWRLQPQTMSNTARARTRARRLCRVLIVTVIDFVIVRQPHQLICGLKRPRSMQFPVICNSLPDCRTTTKELKNSLFFAIKSTQHKEKKWNTFHNVNNLE